ncbi:QRFP-like peptide receptor [Centruroides vittatus]|uniref:QRFP-like peptide receptor n=1 Tax=Centruroides vittatus TaxID=120091 RepID=UPI00350FCA1F
METTNWFHLYINVTADVPEVTNATVLQMFSHVLQEYQHDQLIVTETRNLVLITLYVASFLIAATANTLALLTFFRYRRMRQLPNTLLITLAIADLLVALVCMPMAIGNYTYKLWIFGELMCKLSNYLQAVAVTSSIFTMTVMSLDRYVVICHPITCRRIFGRRHVRMAVVIVWFLAALLFIPILVVRTTPGVTFYDPASSGTYVVFCVEYWQSLGKKRAFGITVFVIVFFIPGLIMGFAYFRIGIRLCEKQKISSIRSVSGEMSSNKSDVSVRLQSILQKRRQVAKRFVILTTVFAACWVPYNFITFLLDCQMNTQMDEALLDFLPFGLLLGHTNSAINPILYCWLNRRFRWCLIDQLKCNSCKNPPYRRAECYRNEELLTQRTSFTPSSQGKQKANHMEIVCSTSL